MKDLLALGGQALALLALMLVGSIVLWVGVPLAWLYLGSKIQGATGDIGAAIGAMIVGVVVSIALLVAVLGRLLALYQRARMARGLEDTGTFPLEVTLTLSAIVAVVGFVTWFVLFSKSSPIPVFG